MSSVSTTSSLSSSLSSIRGYGGLASGLDRDTLIEQMTSGTRSKIAAQEQKKQKIEWEQTALRDITTKVYNYTSTYASYASPSNLTSSKLFSRNQVTAMGENSSKVSVSGTATSADNMSIAGIMQLAKNAGMTTKNASSDTMKTGVVAKDLGAKNTVSTIAGDAIYIKYGTKNYTVKLADNEDYDYIDPAKAVEAVNKQLETVSVNSDETLGDVMEAVYDAKSGKVTLRTKTKSDGSDAAHGNTVQLNGGTGNVLQDLGFLDKGKNFSDLTDEETTITASGLTGSRAKLTETQTIAQQLSGKQIAFSYNGKAQWIKLDYYTSNMEIDDVKDDLQKKLDDAFGKGRIKVGTEEVKNEAGKSEGFRLTFETVKPDGTEDGAPDESSTLSMTAGDGIVGYAGVFKVRAGVSNRVNQSATLSDAGLTNEKKFKLDEYGRNDLMDKDGNYKLVINGKKVEGITKDTTISEIIDKINGTEGIGVKVEYQSMSDRFVLTATDNGASGGIVFDKKDEKGNDIKNNIAELLFGKINADGGITEATDENGLSTNYTKGQDAILSVKYPGSDDPVEIVRASNTFSLDGLNITLKGTFGYQTDDDGNFIKDDDGKPKLDSKAEAITFDASVDADKTVEAVKSMIESFNEILELVNSDVSTKPDRDYQPLTDEQKEELSDDQIEKWEAKAKEGILFADTDLRLMADSLRAVLGTTDRSALSDMGITVSTNYSDNGKLVFDETKFKTALQENPEKVMDVFNRAESTDEYGNTVEGGLMVRIKKVMDKYGSMTGATKGILVERAGSIYAPTTVLSNSLQKQLDSIDDYIERLQDRLETETDRYISQFTTLENLISQMNSQSSYLSSMFA